MKGTEQSSVTRVCRQQSTEYPRQKSSYVQKKLQAQKIKTNSLTKVRDLQQVQSSSHSHHRYNTTTGRRCYRQVTATESQKINQIQKSHASSIQHVDSLDIPSSNFRQHSGKLSASPKGSISSPKSSRKVSPNNGDPESIIASQGGEELFTRDDLEVLKYHLSPESIEDFFKSNEYKEWKINSTQHTDEQQYINSDKFNGKHPSHSNVVHNKQREFNGKHPSNSNVVHNKLRVSSFETANKKQGSSLVVHYSPSTCQGVLPRVQTSIMKHSRQSIEFENDVGYKPKKKVGVNTLSADDESNSQ